MSLTSDLLAQVSASAVDQLKEFSLRINDRNGTQFFYTSLYFFYKLQEMLLTMMEKMRSFCWRNSILMKRS